jgi:hypothetical protein
LFWFRIGGNPTLTERGWQYGQALAKLFNQNTIPGLRNQIAFQKQNNSVSRLTDRFIKNSMKFDF